MNKREHGYIPRLASFTALGKTWVSTLLPSNLFSKHHYCTSTLRESVNMAPVGGASGFDQEALARRVALQGSSGPAALVRNAKVFGIACFACLGGLLYGYNQGVFSGVLAMKSFDRG